jgi:hypothetical protein
MKDRTSPRSRETSLGAWFLLLLVLGLTLIGKVGAGTGHAATPVVLTVSPTTAVPAQHLLLSGSGFAAGETISFAWDTTTLGATAHADANGSFSGIAETVPLATTAGSHTLSARGATSGRLAHAFMTVPAPYVSASPLVVTPGQQFTVTASGFAALETIVFLWDGKSIGTTTATSSGALPDSRGHVPANAAPGTHTFEIEGQTTHHTARVTMDVAATAPAATSTPIPAVGPALPAGVYHMVGSLVASAGAQVSHVEGILTLQAGADGALAGSTLRPTSGATVSVSGAGNRGVLAFDTGGLHFDGHSTAVDANRLSGLFTNSSGGTIGFWVATRIVPQQMGTHYTFTGKIQSGPDAGMSYAGSLELWGDTYGGLLGWLATGAGTTLNVAGQSVNGNVNMGIVVRTGTPMFVSGTTVAGGNLQGTVVGPLAGDQGLWTANK